MPRSDFPKDFVFTAGDPTKKAKKKLYRQVLYTRDSFFNKKTPIHRPKVTSKTSLPPPQEPRIEIIQLSQSEAPWPSLQKRITVGAPLLFTCDPPPKPSWYKLLLPHFQHLSVIGGANVPSSSYLNIRLHALNNILNTKYFSDVQPNLFSKWILGQTLRVLIPMLRVRRLFRHFIQIIRKRKCDKRAEKIDPFTLTESVNSIYVYCFKSKKRYDYDPVSIVRHISTSLRYQNSGFADVRQPKIPQTNEPLSYCQLTSIYEQASKKGIVSQTLANYRSVQWNVIAFAHLFSNDLQRHAIRNEHFLQDSFIARENITYWIETSAITENIFLEDEDYKVIQYALDNKPNHSYLSAWKGIIMNYLVECNIFPNSAERKTAAKNNFHKKCVQLLKLFCDFREQMLLCQYDSDSSSQDE